MKDQKEISELVFWGVIAVLAFVAYIITALITFVSQTIMGEKFTLSVVFDFQSGYFGIFLFSLLIILIIFFKVINKKDADPNSSG